MAEPDRSPDDERDVPAGEPQRWTRSDAAALAQHLVRTSRSAALGTVTADGTPHVSHVAIAAMCDGSPLLLVSDLAMHTKHLAKNPVACLLYVADRGDGLDPNTRARVTLTGTVAPVPDREVAKSRMVRLQPEAALYVDFGDFRLLRFDVARAHQVAGFGRIDALARDDLVLTEGVEAIAAMEASACEHMNEDHADALQLMANHLADAPGGPWIAAALDPAGLDLLCDGRAARVPFGRTVTEPGQLRVVLKRLTDAARAKAAG